MGIHFRDRDDFIQILEVTPATRQAIEDTIDRLVQLLDTLDPDPDLEPSEDDEPWLAGSTGGLATFDLELDEGELEPSLGRLERINQGPASCAGFNWDLEDDDCDQEGVHQ